MERLLARLQSMATTRPRYILERTPPVTKERSGSKSSQPSSPTAIPTPAANGDSTATGSTTAPLPTASHAQSAVETQRLRPDPAQCFGKICRSANARCPPSHDRRTKNHPNPLHPARVRTTTPAPPTPTPATRTSPTKDPSPAIRKELSQTCSARPFDQEAVKSRLPAPQPASVREDGLMRCFHGS